MCFMLLNPFNKCIGVATPKNIIFHPKMAKRNPFFFPKSVFPGFSWSPHAPPTLFLRMLHSQTMCCMSWNAFNNCHSAATTKVHQKRMCFMSLNPFNRCIGVATPRNTILHPKEAKRNPILFTPNQCFPGQGGHFMPPVPYFEDAALTKRCVACHRTHLTIVSGPQPPKIHQKAMCFMLLNPFNKCIGVATPKNAIFHPKMAKRNPIFFTPNQCFLGPGGHFMPPHPILRMLHCQNNVLHALAPI